MDVDNPSSNGQLEPGVSVRMGPVLDEKTGAPVKVGTNGTTNGKRKAATNGRKSYKEESGSEDEDDEPLVGIFLGQPGGYL